MSRMNIIRFHSTGTTCNVLQQIHKSQLSFCHLLCTYTYPAVLQLYVLAVVVKIDTDKAGRKQNSLKELLLILKYDITFTPLYFFNAVYDSKSRTPQKHTEIVMKFTLLAI